MAYTTIDDPSAHFQAKAYTGNGSNGYAITNDGNSDLQPDLWWVKNRDKAYDHNIYDSTRGTSLRLVTNSTAAEATAADRIASFDTNGFTLNSSVISNENNNPHVAWQWKANGGTTVTNTDGSANSTVQANTDAGFSIVEITGTGANATYGHGLGVKPQVYLVKRTSATGNWVWLTSVIDGTHDYFYLNTTGAKNNSSYDQPTSSVFQYNDTSGATNIVYCFAEKQGFSKFGNYTGNGSLDGPFVYLGFKPAFVIVKQRNTARAWQLVDNKRDGYNETNMPYLQPNDSAAEISGAGVRIDLVSNGFKIRSNQTGANQSGGTYIYTAFAENPFVTSTGIPTTAR